MLFLDAGAIIAIISIMVITGLLKKLKSLKPNWKWLPRGFWIALIVGGVSLGICSGAGLIESASESLWTFLGSWIIITGLAGYGNIAGTRLIFFVKALLSKNQTQIEQAQLEIDEHEEKIERLKTKIKKNGK